MVKVPVTNPARIKAITIAVGAASIIAAHLVPTQMHILHTVLQLLGVGIVGVGSLQVVQAPKVGGP